MCVRHRRHLSPGRGSSLRRPTRLGGGAFGKRRDGSITQTKAPKACPGLTEGGGTHGQTGTGMMVAGV